MPYSAEIIVVGCGNILFADDGFGPEVIKALGEYSKENPLPDNVMLIDAGTGGHTSCLVFLMKNGRR